MTNRQWIDSLSDEELVAYSGENNGNFICQFIHDYDCENTTCTDCILAWLRAEHKED